MANYNLQVWGRANAWGLVWGGNDSVTVEVVCQSGFNGAIVGAFSDDDATARSFRDNIGAYICVDTCERRRVVTP